MGVKFGVEEGTASQAVATAGRKTSKSVSEWLKYRRVALRAMLQVKIETLKTEALLNDRRFYHVGLSLQRDTIASTAPCIQNCNSYWTNWFLAALRSRCGHYIFIMWLLLYGRPMDEKVYNFSCVAKLEQELIRRWDSERELFTTTSHM